MDELDITELEVKPSENGKAIALIRGVLAAFKNNGHKIGGFMLILLLMCLKAPGYRHRRHLKGCFQA